MKVRRVQQELKTNNKKTEENNEGKFVMATPQSL
jgi:hypothetical protein